MSFKGSVVKCPNCENQHGLKEIPAQTVGVMYWFKGLECPECGTVF